MKHTDLIDAYYDELSDIDAVVLLLSDVHKTTSKTRYMKLALCYLATGETNLPGTVFSYGYCDDVEEAVNLLHSRGILFACVSGYQLSNFGQQLREYVVKNNTDDRLCRCVEHIRRATDLLSDKDLVALTSVFFPELAANPAITHSVKKHISAHFGSANSLNKHAFIRCMKIGVPITKERLSQTLLPLAPIPAQALDAVERAKDISFREDGMWTPYIRKHLIHAGAPLDAPRAGCVFVGLLMGPPRHLCVAVVSGGDLVCPGYFTKRAVHVLHTVDDGTPVGALLKKLDDMYEWTGDYYDW